MTRSTVKVTAMTNIHCYPFTTMQDMIIHNPVEYATLCCRIQIYEVLGSFFQSLSGTNMPKSLKAKYKVTSARPQGGQRKRKAVSQASSPIISASVCKSNNKIISWLT